MNLYCLQSDLSKSFSHGVTSVLMLVSNAAQSDSPILNISDVFLSLDVVTSEAFGDQLFRANHTWKAALWNVCSSQHAGICA